MQINAGDQIATIANGRPLAMKGDPICLFHGIFTQFTQDLENTKMRIPTELIKKSNEYAEVACKLYALETDRQNAIKEILQDLIGRHLSSPSTQGGTFKPDEAVEVGNFWPVIIEIKNELGPSTSDASLQNAVGYTKYISQPIVRS